MVDRRSVFRHAALEAQAYGEIGEPRLAVPRWTLVGSLLLVAVLAVAVYIALTGSMMLRSEDCQAVPAAEAEPATCIVSEVRPARDLLARPAGDPS